MTGERFEEVTMNDNKSIFSNKTYDIAKFVAQIVLPAIGALYFGLANIWGLPWGEEVVGTITVLDTALGAILVVSNANYKSRGANYDGEMLVDESYPEKDIYSLSLSTPPEDLKDKETITFKVVKSQ